MHIEVKCTGAWETLIVPADNIVLTQSNTSNGNNCVCNGHNISKEEFERIREILRVLSGEYLKELIGQANEKVRKDFREHIGVTFGLEV